ncbi:MAG TPA: hypothetical protein GXZ95_01680 [Mollicutes bacterium]|nr:hypothetical protein [Mollicutes bacterium]
MIVKELEEMRISLKNIKDEIIKERAKIKTGAEIYEFNSYKGAPLSIRKWLAEIIKSMIERRKELDTGLHSSKVSNSKEKESSPNYNAVLTDNNQVNEQGGISITKRSSHFRSAPPGDNKAA